MGDRRAPRPVDRAQLKPDPPTAPPPPRHPAVTAWESFRLAYAPVFDGSPDGHYLENRLRTAFEQGWNAAERAVRHALGSQP